MPGDINKAAITSRRVESLLDSGVGGDWTTTPAPGEETIPVATVAAPLRVLTTDAGCWVDGVHGIYAPVRMVHIAMDCGMPYAHPEIDHALLVWAEAGQHGDGPMEGSPEAWQELCDEAEAWLNENAAPAGYAFGWCDGDFMLAHVTWWEGDEVGYGRDSNGDPIAIDVRGNEI